MDYNHRQNIAKLKNMLLDPNVDLENARLELKHLQAMVWNFHDGYMFSNFSQVFKEGSQQVVELLLECEFDKFVKKAFDYDLLLYIFANRNFEAQDLLRNRPFDVNAMHHSETALKLAVKYGSERRMTFLLDMGANPNFPTGSESRFAQLNNETHFSTGEENPLSLAVMSASISKINLLLDRGADPNFRDSFNATALHVARDVDVILLLLQRGAKIQLMDRYHQTVFKYKNQMTQLKPLVAHLALLVMQRVLFTKWVMDQVKSKTETKDYYQNCLQQLKWMKKQKIYGSTSMYAVMIDRFGKVPRGEGIHDLLSKVLDSAREHDLDIYYITLLNQKFNALLLIHDVKNRAAQKLSEFMVIFDSDHIVIDRIVNFLAIEDVSNVSAL